MDPRQARPALFLPYSEKIVLNLLPLVWTLLFKIFFWQLLFLCYHLLMVGLPPSLPFCGGGIQPGLPPSASSTSSGVDPALTAIAPLAPGWFAAPLTTGWFFHWAHPWGP